MNYILSYLYNNISSFNYLNNRVEFIDGVFSISISYCLSQFFLSVSLTNDSTNCSSYVKIFNDELSVINYLKSKYYMNDCIVYNFINTSKAGRQRLEELLTYIA